MKASQRTMRRRSLGAVLLVVLFLATVALSGELERAMAQGASQESEMPGLSLPSLQQDPTEVLDQIETELESTERYPSDEFVQEIGLLPGATDIRCDEGMTVVSYQVKASEQETLEQLEEQHSSHGWVAVPLGEGCGATFIRTEDSLGSIRWFLATCSQIGQATSVVIRMAS